MTIWWTIILDVWRRPVRQVLGGCLVMSVGSAVLAQTSFCDGPASPLAPSRNLYCIELVPAVGIRAGTGRVELGRAAGPFTINVSADGHLRYTPTITLTGLERPSSLGRYAAYVAWVASPTMDVVQRRSAASWTTFSTCCACVAR